MLQIAYDCENSGERSNSRFGAFCEWLLCLAVAAFEWLGVPHTIWGDGGVRFDTLVQLVDQGKISPNRYSIIHSFLAAPLYVLGKARGHGGEVAAYFNVLLFHLTILVLYWMMRRHLPPAILRRTILLLLAASMFGNHVQAFYGEVLTACAAILGLSALAIGSPTFAGFAMCVAVVNTPSALLALVLCNGAWFLKTRRWFQSLWPVLLSPLLIAAEYWWRRGLPLRSGYETDTGWPSVLPYAGHGGFSYPLLLGVLSLLFSFGKGIFIYQPGLILHYFRTRNHSGEETNTLEQLSVIFLWGMLLAHASWWAWHGSVFWGPRFLLIAGLPASLALARHISAEQRPRVAVTVLTVLALVWSVWVGVNATVIHEGYPAACTDAASKYESLCWYVPEFSPLIHPLVAPSRYSPWDWSYMWLSAVVAFALAIPMLVRRIRESAILALSRRTESRPEL